MGMSACTHLTSVRPCEQNCARSPGCQFAAEIMLLRFSFWATVRQIPEGQIQEWLRNYRPDHITVIKLSSVNKIGFSFQYKKSWLFFPLKKNIDVGGLLELCLTLFLLTFSFSDSFFHFFFLFSLLHIVEMSKTSPQCVKNKYSFPKNSGALMSWLPEPRFCEQKGGRLPLPPALCSHRN